MISEKFSLIGIKKLVEAIDNFQEIVSADELQLLSSESMGALISIVRLKDQIKEEVEK